MSFSCDIITDPEIRQKLERIGRVKSIVRGPICLPNIHRKRGLESPPQFVAATNNTIVPMLSAPAMNCGMSIFKTDLFRKDFSPDFLQSFAKSLRNAVGKRITKTNTLLQWLGLHLDVKRPKQYDLSRSELESFFLDGARAAIKKYDLPASELDHIEYKGNVISNEERNTIDLKSIVPRSSYLNGRHEIGYNFGGNHFLEFHFVEKIENNDVAGAWGIKEGQIMIIYHGGGGHATYHLGRYFARREKNSFLEKTALFWLKFVFHFGSFEGIKNFCSRWRYYFSRSFFPEIPLYSLEGKRLMHSIKIAANYGYAFRIALLRRINDSLPKGKASFLWDSSHNSIMEEKIGDKQYIVHRQDALRVFTGKPVLIAGGNNTLSYLGIGGSDTQKSISSITPSAAKTIDTFILEGKSHSESPDLMTLVSRRKKGSLKPIRHISSEGLFDVVHKFEEENIIKPVAYLRPIGNIKGH